MRQATLAIEKSYKKINERMELYLQPDPTKRISTRFGASSKKEQFVTDDMIAKEPICKVAQCDCASAVLH